MHLLQDIATVGFVVLALALLIPSRGRINAWRLPLLCVCAAFAAFKAYTLIHLAVASVHNPPLWDFRAFYMFGRVAASHHNVYDPASYQMYGPLLNPLGDPEFNAIALNIGLPYPPPAVLLVYPLGLFANLSTAMTAWYLAIFAAITASILVIWRMFFAAEGGAGLIATTVLVLAMPATWMNVGLAQVTFFVLLLLLVFWRERAGWRAGSWLAPLVVLRPLFVVLAIFFAVRRQWSALASLVITSVALIAISIPLLGPNGFATYLFHNPVQRYPGSYFLGTQCLYKLMATLSHTQETSFSLAAHPLFNVLAILTVIAAGFICAVCVKRQPDACLGLLLAVALWVYPSTDTHYCVLLLVPMCAVWRYRERLALSSNAVVAFFGVHYLLLGVRSGVQTTGLVIALDCLFFAFLAFRRPVPSRSFEHRTRQVPFAVGGHNAAR